MTEPAAEPGYKHDHNCETPGCVNDFAVIEVTCDTSESHFRCMACQQAFWLAVLRQLAAQGTLGPDLETAAPAGT